MTSCKFYLKRETQERWILFTYEFKKEKKQFYSLWFHRDREKSRIVRIISILKRRNERFEKQIKKKKKKTQSFHVKQTEIGMLRKVDVQIYRSILVSSIVSKFHLGRKSNGRTMLAT